MTKAEFLSQPVGALYRGFVPPPEWIVEAWEGKPLREEVLYELRRSVSKTGSPRGAGWLDMLSPALSCPQAVELYEAVRDGTERSESEWRMEFEEAFPSCVAELPPIDRRRELFNAALGLFLAVSWNDMAKVQDRLGLLHRGGFEVGDAVVRVGELRAFPDFASSPALVGLPDSDALSAVSFAERLSHHAALAVLRGEG